MQQSLEGQAENTEGSSTSNALIEMPVLLWDQAAAQVPARKPPNAPDKPLSNN